MKLPKNRRGSVSLLTAASLLSVLGLSGLAVDGTRIWMVHARLKAATDAAALTAARRFDQPTRDAEATGAFYANYNPEYRAGQPATARQTYLGATSATPVVSQVGDTSVRVAATATVPTTLLGLVRNGPVTVSESSTAGRAGTGLELALVVDTTWSMTLPATGYTNKLAAAKAAVNTLLDTLYGTKDTQPYLWVSVVPFTTAVNIGTDSTRTGWLTGTAPTYPSGQSWTGCVEMRRNGGDITEYSPVSNPGPGPAEAKFYRYFWPSTYRQNGQYIQGNTAQSKCTDSQAYPASSGARYCRGHNDWGATTSELNNNPIIQSYGNSSGASFGPSAWCPASAIQPLTASKTAVRATVEGLQARFGFGTVIPAGLQAGWFTLSPHWQQEWGVPTPPNGLPVPNQYTTSSVQKVVVLLSDGDNNWYNARTMDTLSRYEQDIGGYPSIPTMASMTAPENQRTELFYNGYGRLHPAYTNAQGTAVAASNRLGVTIPNSGNLNNLASEYNTAQANADAKLDDRTRALCDAMKAKGILIYTIGFEVAAGSAQETLLRQCASPNSSNTADLSKRLYYVAPTAAQLKSVFSTIANRLATPRLMD